MSKQGSTHQMKPSAVITLFWNVQSPDERAPALSGHPYVLTPLQILWISYFHWHYMAMVIQAILAWKADLSALNFNQSAGGQEGRCVWPPNPDPSFCPFGRTAWHFPYLTPGRFANPAWLTSTFESPLSKTEGQLPKAGNLQQRHRTEGASLPNATCLIQISSYVQEPKDSLSPTSGLLALWPASFCGWGFQWAQAHLQRSCYREPTLDPMGEPRWPLHGSKHGRWQGKRGRWQRRGIPSSQLDQEGSQ